MEGRAFVGTSGWNYRHWRGCVYEAGLAQRSWLQRIAQQFDTVEVNTSFYRIPKPETVTAWHEGTRETFLFALKLWRGITHYRKLKNAGDLTLRFLESAEMLPENRRAPLLIQLPPNQGVDVPKLEAYLQEFRALAPTPWRIAVEFRNDSWLRSDVRTMLDRENAALCLHDMAGAAAVDEPNDVPFVYIRRHGQRYSGSYSSEEIACDAERIQRWLGEGRSAYVYYNNDIGGHAYHNALALRSALSL